MPIYEYKCKKCGRVNPRIFRVDDFPYSIYCNYCDGEASKIISLPQAVKPAWDEYYDENLDSIIKGREHRKRLMKERGLEEKWIDPTVLRIRKERMEHKKREEQKDGR